MINIILFLSSISITGDAINCHLKSQLNEFEDTLYFSQLNVDIPKLLEFTDTLELLGVNITGTSNDNFAEVNVGPMEDGLTIVKINSDHFLLKYYIDLPLNSFDSVYVKTEIINLDLFFTRSNDNHNILFVVDKMFKPNLNWYPENASLAIYKWHSLIQNDEYGKPLIELTEEQSDEILELHYDLFYSALMGDEECLIYYKMLQNHFPAIKGLNDYSTSSIILSFYGLI